jgi:hypothetical protein
MSASSRRRTHPHLCASWKLLSRLVSTSAAVSPISPHVIGKSGLFVVSATHSAVEVFPTPTLQSVSLSHQRSFARARTRRAMQQDDQAFPFTPDKIDGLLVLRSTSSCGRQSCVICNQCPYSLFMTRGQYQVTEPASVFDISDAVDAEFGPLATSQNEPVHKRRQ